MQTTPKKTKRGTAILGAVGIITGLAIAAGLGLSSSGKTASGARQAESLQESFVSVSESLAPSVVNISTEQVLKYRYNGYNFNDLFDRFFNLDEEARPRERQFKRTGLGTGLIVSEDGYILTNFHVIKEMTKITVIFSDKSSYAGKVTGTDKARDLALIKIEPGKKLIKAVLGDSSKVRVGQWAVAVGNPFGYDHTVTAGIVSATGRVFEDSDATGVRRLPNLIQTDAAINPGNSGGPLSNINGEVIGINVAIVSTSGSYAGIGFAIPINDAKEAIAGMMKNGPAKSYSAWLGLKLQELTGGLKKKFAVENGALVSFVEAGSPAAQAGFAAGDIVAEADGIKITGTDQFSSLMNIKLPGQTMRFAVIRNGSALIATLKLGQVSGKEKVLSGANYLGMYVSDLTPGMVAKYDISEHAGAVIIAIDRNSKAMSGGLNEGDLIVEIDKQPVRNTEDFNKITSKASLDNGVLIVITRSGKSMYTVLYR